MGDRAPKNDMVRGTLRKASKVVDAPLRRTEEAVRKIAERPNIDLMDAPHLAWEFLQKGRQQADAIIAARQKIVHGAVSMVQMALRDLSEQNVIEFDADRKAADRLLHARSGRHHVQQP